MKKRELGVDILVLVCYAIDTLRATRRGITTQKGSEGMDEMTAPELNAFLENLARLIEASANSPEDAARLVRESKIKA